MSTQINKKQNHPVLVPVCHRCGRKLWYLIGLELFFDKASIFRYNFFSDRLLCAECKAEIQNQEQEKEE